MAKIYSPTIEGILSTAIGKETLYSLSPQERKNVVGVTFGYIMGVTSYTSFTKQKVLNANERLAVRNALKTEARLCVKLKLAILSIVKFKLKPSKGKQLLLEYGLQEGDYTLFRLLKDFRLTTALNRKVQKVQMPLSVKGMDEALALVVSEIAVSLKNNTRRKLEYVYRSQGLDLSDFTTIVLERAILSFYTYYPIYNHKSLTLSSAKAGHNFIENIRGYYAVPGRARIIEEALKDKQFDASSTAGASIYTTDYTSDNQNLCVVGPTGTQASPWDSKRIDLGYDSDLICNMSMFHYKGKLVGTKAAILDILCMVNNEGFLSYCYNQYGFRATNMKEVARSALKVGPHIFLEAIRTYYKVGYKAFYQFLDEIKDSLGGDSFLPMVA